MATNKRAGNHAAQQNDFLAPYAPTIGTATDVGTARAYNNGAATVTFTPDARNAATSYTVTSSPDGFTGTGASSPITVTGLLSNTVYTFTVTATNSYGTSAASSASSSITATTVPDAPGVPSVSSVGVNNATPQGTAPATDTVSWTAPNNGGKAITNYHWSSSDGKAGDVNALSVAVTQESGTSQTWSVYATNANGNSNTSTSASLTSAFSFVPFGAFGFSPFGFSPFGFSPFGFSPYYCIAENTEVATVVDGSVIMVKAKDLEVGSTVLSPTWSEYSNNDDPYTSRVEYASITNKNVINGTIAKITTKNVDKTIIINDNPEKKYSLTQPVLARKIDGVDAWENTEDLSAGDIIWEYDFNTKVFSEVEISSLDIIDGEETVYALSIDGIHTFIAGGVISHNKL